MGIETNQNPHFGKNQTRARVEKTYTQHNTQAHKVMPCISLHIHIENIYRIRTKLNPSMCRTEPKPCEPGSSWVQQICNLKKLVFLKFNMKCLSRSLQTVDGRCEYLNFDVRLYGLQWHTILMLGFNFLRQFTNNIGRFCDH